MASVQEKQATRLRVLLALYEVTDGNRHARVNYRAIANDLGLEHDVASSAVQYLVDEGLAKWAAMGGMIAIFHLGVREAEAVLGGRTTHHFGAPIINIINVSGGSTVGNIQQGTVASEQDGT
jgi:hypothetical protein